MFGRPGFGAYQCRSESKYSEQPGDGVVEFIDHSLLEGNDGVLGDGDVFGTNFAATGCDVAIADTVGLLQFTDSIFNIERMHLKRGNVHKETWASEFVEIAVLAQHMANILAQKALDTFSEFLYAVDILLRHTPSAIR